jgi:16S rRNA C967 or C1407 C5-methylase (RsmB/RsmF family)
MGRGASRGRTDAAAGAALVDGLPAAFVERLRALIPPEHVEAALASFSAPPPLTARVNTLRATPDAVRAALAADGIATAPVGWLDEGLVLDPADRERVVRHPTVEDGSLYIQGASSWLPVMLLDPRPGEEVLDLAAAPGGKAAHLAARMNDTGRLACVEPIRGRFFRLKATLERAGATCAQLYLKDGRGVGGAVPARFDRVLLDAPCSSETSLRAHDPASQAHWSERKVREQARKQRGLLRSAFQALKPGGRLVYATCSLAPEEDEATLDDLLRAHPDAELVDAALPPEVPALPGRAAWRGEAFDPRVARAHRVVPGGLFGAFFVAVVVKG